MRTSHPIPPGAGLKTMSEDPHAIQLASKRKLAYEKFYVRSISLMDVDGSFAASANLIPWPAATGQTESALVEHGNEEVLLYYGGLELLSKSLSILNLLTLQGKLITAKPVKWPDLSVHDAVHQYYIERIDTLHGPDFERALKREYSPVRR